MIYWSRIDSLLDRIKWNNYAKEHQSVFLLRLRCWGSWDLLGHFQKLTLNPYSSVFSCYPMNLLHSPATSHDFYFLWPWYSLSFEYLTDFTQVQFILQSPDKVLHLLKALPHPQSHRSSSLPILGALWVISLRMTHADLH